MPGPPPSRWHRLRKRLERYVLAHAVAYPIAFLWAMASEPLAMVVYHEEIDALWDDPTAAGYFIAWRVIRLAAVIFALPHLIAIPWAFGRDPARWARPTWVGIAAVAAVGALFGAVSWLWLFLR